MTTINLHVEVCEQKRPYVKRHFEWADNASRLHSDADVARMLRQLAAWIDKQNAGAVPRRGSDVGTSPLLADSESGKA